MTKWQWKIIIALIRLFLNHIDESVYSYHDCDRENDLNILREAVIKDRDYES
jgi:hypothetical protein